MKLSRKDAVTNEWRFFEKHPTRVWVFSVLWLGLICGLAFLWNLGGIGLVDETEPLFAEAARQMTVTGDWITPYFNGQTRFDKPPLVYWLMAISYKLIGVNEWAVRFPSALGAIALTVMGFYTLRRFGISRPAASDSRANRQRWLAAWIGSALIAVNPQTIVWARTGVSDMLLSGCMGTALLCFFLGYARGEGEPQATRQAWGWYLAFYVLVALAILAKGPVGIVLPGLTIGAFLLYLGKVREVWREMRPILGGVIILAIALPWYVLVTLRNGEDYIDTFFGYHNFQRFTDVVNHHSAPWYFYFLVVLIGFAPWSIYLPVAIARLRVWRREGWRNAPRSTQLGLFALFWFVMVFGFFTIAVTKLPSYVIPLLPAAAILVALSWSDYLTNPGKRRKLFEASFTISGGLNVLFLAVLAGAVAYSPNFIGHDPAAPNLSELMAQSGLAERGAVIWGACAIASAVLLLRRDWRRWLWGVNLVGLVAFILLVITPASEVMDRARQLPLRQLSALAAQVDRPGEELIMVGFEKPSVAFYSQRPVNYMKEAEEAIAHIQSVTATRPNASFLILARPTRLEDMALQPNEYTHLESAGAYELIRVSKQAIANKPSSN